MVFRISFLFTFLFFAAAVVIVNADDTYWVCCESAGGKPGCKVVKGSLSTNYNCEEKTLNGRVKKGQDEYSLEKTFAGTGASQRVTVKVAACDDDETFQVTKSSNGALVYQCDLGFEGFVVRFDDDYY